MAGDTFKIWSWEHLAWWRPNRAGYTKDLREAGDYSFGEAAQIVLWHIPAGEEVAVHTLDTERMLHGPEEFGRKKGLGSGWRR